MRKFWLAILGALLLLAASCSPDGGRGRGSDSTDDGTGSTFGNDTTGTSVGGTGDGTGGDTSTGDDTGSSTGDTGPQGIPCTGDEACPAYLPLCSPEGFCVACFTDEDCDGTLCFDGQCLACTPGQKICSGLQVIQCNENQSGFDVVEDCPAGGTCNGGQCFNCYPGTKKCEGSIASECTPQGTEWVKVQDCADAGLQCLLGVCLSPCGADFKANTNAGCGFYAVDLDNAIDFNGIETLDAFNAQFAVVVSNTSNTQAADVTVTQPDGTKETKTVEARSLQTFLLPAKFGLDETVQNNNAFKIDATLPITVYQFNPLSNQGVFSNDASVLLPAAGLGSEYYALSHRQIEEKFRGYVTVVGISEATTSVTVTPRVKTKAGGGIPSIAANADHTFSIEQGEVVNIESDVANGDLTGTHVVADGPIAVFSGHEAAVTSDQCCADHLEQQMVPVSAWGTSYVMTRSWPRGIEKDWYRVVAAQNQTTIQVNPAVTSPPVQVLQAGGFIEFATDSSFTVSADKPIMVGQMLSSSFEVVMGSGGGGGFCFSDAECPALYTCLIGQCIPPSCGGDADCPGGHTCATGMCSPIGDPALILGVAVEQWREEYVFLTPNSYAKDYINVVSEAGAVVTLDKTTIAPGAWEAIPGSTYVLYRTLVEDGVHELESDKPVGVIVYGYDKDVSYGYPGGVGLGAL